MNILRARGAKILLLLCLLAVLVPVGVKRRIVVLSKTPMVIPISSTTTYSEWCYRRYGNFITRASEKYDVPATLIAAVIKAESNFNPYAVSGAGAMGLMQLMPATWAELGGIGSPFNPGQSINLGTKYLKELLEKFGGNWALTLAAYNAGPGAVMKYGCIPPYEETRRYVPRVIMFYRNFMRLIGIG